MQMEDLPFAIIENANDPIWAVDLNGRLTFFNEVYLRAFPISPGNLATTDLNLWPTGHDDALAPFYQRALNEGACCAEITLPDGRTLDLEFSSLLQHGKPVGVSVFAKDITDRKLALETLRRSEEQLRNAEQIAFTGSSVWDAASGSSTWTEGLFRIMGLDPQGPVPTSDQHSRLFTPESWDRLTRAARDTIDTGKPYDIELQILRNDGQTRWIHARGIAKRDGSGRVTQILGVARDITDNKIAHARLLESEDRYRSTFEQAAIGIVHAAFDGRILRCNARFAQMVGYSIGEINGIPYQQITAPEPFDSTANALDQLLDGKTAFVSWEKQYVRKDNSLVWVKLTSSIQRDSAGRPLHLETFVEDISARKEAEQLLAQAQDELRVSEMRYRTVFQTSLDGIIVSRLDDGLFIDVNPAFLKMMGFERNEVIGRSSEQLNMWTDIKIRQGIVDLLNRDASFRSLTVPFRRKNGSVFWMQLSASVIDVDGVQCVVYITRDISEIRAAEEKIKNLALYDQLTRLPNRRLLLERLEEPSSILGSADVGERALLYLDLDSFKKLNDTYGHHIGDLLLQEVARRLLICVRGDDTVARCDADEFAVLLEGLGAIPDPAATQAEFVANKIASVVAQPYLLDGHEYHCNCSIGITIFRGNSHSPLQVLQQAELALHQAKIDGHNATHFFEPALQAAAAARATIESDLRLAVRCNQFLVYYQPQVNASGLVGAEALVRWEHPEHGILPPSAFISLAEETGLILPIGDFVLREACAQIALWAAHTEAVNIVLSVNISARQFRQSDFVDKVLEALQSTGANPANLRLELTESMLVDNFENVIEKMSALKNLGIRFSIDDFGTGYSSLSYLKRLPIDQLKIDRSFVSDILDETGSAIAQAIISLGRAMGVSVIAEGVETEQQRCVLSTMGCDVFQGFLFGTPLPIDQFEKQWVAPQPAKGPLLVTTQRSS